VKEIYHLLGRSAVQFALVVDLIGYTHLPKKLLWESRPKGRQALTALALAGHRLNKTQGTGIENCKPITAPPNRVAFFDLNLINGL